MTIDEHIEQLKKLRSFHNGSYGTSVNFAIDTMRKYQKIEQIIKDHDKGSIPEKYWHIGKIREVLESEEKE